MINSEELKWLCWWGYNWISTEHRNVYDLTEEQTEEVKQFWQANWQQVTKSFETRYHYDSTVQPFAFYLFDLGLQPDDAFEEFSKARRESEETSSTIKSDKTLEKYNTKLKNKN